MEKFRRVRHSVHVVVASHKKHCFSAIAIVVLVVHYVAPEYEAIGFAVAGVITSEFA